MAKGLTVFTGAINLGDEFSLIFRKDMKEAVLALEVRASLPLEFVNHGAGGQVLIHPLRKVEKDLRLFVCLFSPFLKNLGNLEEYLAVRPRHLLLFIQGCLSKGNSCQVNQGSEWGVSFRRVEHRELSAIDQLKRPNHPL